MSQASQSFISDTDRAGIPRSKHAVISLIVPVHNEEGAVGLFLDEIANVASALSDRDVTLEIVFVNDGSSDGTLAKLIEASRRDQRIRIIDLSRNFGKESAMTAGLDNCQGDAAIPIDVDLQDPPKIIPLLIDKWREGYDVVLAKRADRSSDTVLKQRSASMFYRVPNWMAAQKIPPNVGDFRLVDREVIEALKALPERRRFMKGLFAWVGFPTATVEYVRDQRAAGNTKFSGWKLWNFALEGITSFSTVPLEIWSYVGALISLGSFVYGLFIATKTLIFGVDVPGYASLLVSVLFLGGVQILGIGILGQYLGRVYSEIKQRPIYIVRRNYGGK